MAEHDQLREKLARWQFRAMMQNHAPVVRVAGENNLGLLASLNRLADLELERRWQNASRSARPGGNKLSKQATPTLHLKNPAQADTLDCSSGARQRPRRASRDRAAH